MGSESPDFGPIFYLSNDMHALEIVSLSKAYLSGFLKKVQALQEISLTIEEDEIFGFLGPNGAGKTTTLKIVTGLLKPTYGDVKILGAPLSQVNIRKQIGFLPEHPSYYNHLTGFEILDFAGGLCCIPGFERKKRIERLFDRVRLKEVRNVRVSEYSKGMIQRLGIAQALINNPELVILDEPLSGLDPIGRKELKDIIISLKDEGKTVFFSTHILADVEMICNRVGILHKGRLLKVGKLNDFLSDTKRNVIITFEFTGRVKPTLIQNVNPTAEGYLNVTIEKEKQNTIVKSLQNEGASIISIVPETITLEDFFVAEIKKDEN